MPRKENAPAGTRATNTANHTREYKRDPAFGKQISKLRLSGRVPSNLVMVTFAWNVARIYPRIILDDNIQPSELEFGYLAGIPVQVVYQVKDSHRVNSVVEEILKVNPSWLATFSPDLMDTGEATTIIKPFQNTQTQGIR